MLLSNMELIATAPGGVAKLRELILTLAVQGKLVPQDPADEPAGVLLQKIRAEKDRLVAEGKIKRDKPLAEIAEEEKPFELPQGWEWVRLGVVVNASEAGWSPTCIGSPRRPGHWGVLKVSAVSWGRFDPTANKELPSELTPKPEYEVKDGDFLLSRANTAELVARSVVVGVAEPQLMLSDKIIRLAVSSQMNRAFLNMVNNASYSREHYAANASGTSSSMKNVSREVVLALPVPLPPLAEQSRIVTRVEALMRLCDALEAKGHMEAAQHAQLVSTLLGTLTASTTPEELAAHWQRVAQHFDLLLDRPEAIDALEQTLLQLAVRGLLVPQDPTDEPASALLQKIRAEKDRLIATGQIKRDKPLPPITDEEKPFELPVGWEWVRMGALIELVSGQHLGPSEYVDGLTASLPYLTGPAEFGALSPDPTRSTHERRAVAICDDILITVKGSGVGKLNVVKHDEMLSVGS
ncbi:restriction endonuclease subunit S [Diaphorobacter sp. ED-3]|uniref:restriction endonuclease subunit S n=1 Tax=Diaphorobacter sp. ED-3 TaxID=3016636 RepID=UPI0022DD71F4|nr:restriction endonuclease subunit S [Diaphorobacter sp. ED-3]